MFFQNPSCVVVINGHVSKKGHGCVKGGTFGL